MTKQNPLGTHKQVSIRITNTEYEMLREWAFMQRTSMSKVLHDLVVKLLTKVGKDIKLK